MKRRTPDKPGPKRRAAKPSPAAARDAAKRAALNALRRAQRAAARAGVELSDWEGEFLQSLQQRIKTYGRAFADPDKGAMGAPLSMMQGAKLREISDKAKGKPMAKKRPGGGFGHGKRRIQRGDESV